MRPVRAPPSLLLPVLLVAAAFSLPGPAAAQQSAAATAHKRLTLWDLPLGRPARELPRREFADFACGTNGGPPAAVLAAWTGYDRCPPEKDSGLREVYFRYDDEVEYLNKAVDPLGQAPFRPEGTAEYLIPVIVSGLFDSRGFLVGLRMITDPRTDEDMRERGVELGGAIMARFGVAGWQCRDLPPAAGETAFRGDIVKQRCERSDAGILRTLAMSYLRRPGHTALNLETGRPTTGDFVSETRFETTLTAPIADADQHLAAIVDPPPDDAEMLAQHARNCPGCDLRGANLKRADLRNARLAGADLSGAVLHGANLAGADLTGARLTDANLNRADLRQAKLAGADLTEAYLYAARLDGANLTGADLTAVLAARAQFTSGVAAGLIAANADLRFARLTGIDLSGADLSGTLLQDTQMARANLRGAKLADAQMWNASLTDAALVNADARRVQLQGANLRGADLSGADFSDAQLDQTGFAGATAPGARFDGAQPPPPAGLR